MCAPHHFTRSASVAGDHSGTTAQARDTLQKFGHLSPSALAILHWFIQLQNKTNLLTL